MKNDKNPNITVIIINKNDRGIDSTLVLLGKQRTGVPYETIVVDASEGRLDDIYDNYSFVRKIAFQNSSHRITIAEQRNIGVKSAKGSIIVFIDASCLPSEKWLEILVEPIISGKELIVAGGTLSTGTKTFHDSVYAKKRNKRYLSTAPTINLAIDKSVFNKVGYFDESFLYGSDTDFTWRCINGGYRILNAPAALITHDWGGLNDEAKRAYRYGQAKTKLYRKHRLGLANFAKHESTILFYVGFTIGLPLTFWIPFYPLLILIPIIKNSRSNAFKRVTVNFITAYGAVNEFIVGG